MALTVTETIDPAGEPAVRSLEPNPLDLQHLDLSKAVVSYDRRSDILLIHLFGRDRDSVSVQRDRGLYFLVDPRSEDVVGFQLEGFLAHGIKSEPALIDLLDFAELRGITPAEVRAVRRRALGVRQRLARWARSLIASSPQEGKRLAILSFVDDKRPRPSFPMQPATG
jgi:hypothetical protein